MTTVSEIPDVVTVTRSRVRSQTTARTFDRFEHVGSVDDLQKHRTILKHRDEVIVLCDEYRSTALLSEDGPD